MRQKELHCVCVLPICSQQVVDEHPAFEKKSRPRQGRVRARSAQREGDYIWLTPDECSCYMYARAKHIMVIKLVYQSLPVPVA